MKRVETTLLKGQWKICSSPNIIYLHCVYFSCDLIFLTILGHVQTLVTLCTCGISSGTCIFMSNIKSETGPHRPQLTVTSNIHFRISKVTETPTEEFVNSH